MEMPIYLFDSISTLLNISIGAVEGELGRSVSVWKNEKLEDGPRLLWQDALEEERRGRVMVSDFILEAAAGFHEGNVIERARGIICPGSQGDNWWTVHLFFKEARFALGLSKLV